MTNPEDSETIEQNEEQNYLVSDGPDIYVEQTLAIIKPDAVYKSHEIEDVILRTGFTILKVRFSNF